jgi:hypothetical protein
LLLAEAEAVEEVLLLVVVLEVCLPEQLIQ